MFIDDNIDKGTLIHQMVTKFNFKCSLKQFYKTHYEQEISMLINFEKFLKNGNKYKLKVLEPNKRFPKIRENDLVKKFASYTKNLK